MTRLQLFFVGVLGLWAIGLVGWGFMEFCLYVSNKGYGGWLFCILASVIIGGQVIMGYNPKK